MTWRKPNRNRNLPQRPNDDGAYCIFPHVQCFQLRLPKKYICNTPCNISGFDSFSPPQLFCTYFYNHSHRLRLEIGGIYERGFVFFPAIFLLKFRKTGPRTKLPKSPRTLPPQPLVDMSALENFQPRPANTFSVARNKKYRI